MQSINCESVRARAAALRLEAPKAAEGSEYPRRAASTRIELANALDALADVWEATEADWKDGLDRAARQARRIVKLQRLAALARVEAAELDLESHRIGNLRPFGQPILVGHHSERRHRRDLERQHNLDRRRFQAAERAKRLQEKAEACRVNAAVYRDDVNAVEKLQAKADSLVRTRDCWKALNAEYRRAKGDIDAMAGVTEAGKQRLKAEREGWYMGPDNWRPVHSYQLSNLGAELRRLQRRITELEAAAERQERPARYIGQVEVRDNFDFQKVELHFPGKPDDSIRTLLKRCGFRWVRTAGCWSRSIGNDTEYRLQLIAKELGHDITIAHGAH